MAPGKLKSNGDHETAQSDLPAEPVTTGCASQRPPTPTIVSQRRVATTSRSVGPPVPTAQEGALGVEGAVAEGAGLTTVPVKTGAGVSPTVGAAAVDTVTASELSPSVEGSPPHATAESPSNSDETNETD